MSSSKLPEGWDEGRINRVLTHCDEQSDADAVAEDEAAYEAPTHTFIQVPVELLPQIHKLIDAQAQH